MKINKSKRIPRVLSPKPLPWLAIDSSGIACVFSKRPEINAKARIWIHPNESGLRYHEFDVECLWEFFSIIIVSGCTAITGGFTVMNSLDANIPALSIRQPWAEAVARGIKTVENRSRPTKFRGRFYIHATARNCFKWRHEFSCFVLLMEPRSRADMVPLSMMEELRFGGIIGMAEIVDCVTVSDSPWFTGPFGWIIANAQSFADGKILPCRGRLGFFKPKIEEGK